MLYYQWKNSSIQATLSNSEQTSGYSSVTSCLGLKFKLYLSIYPVLPDLFNMLSCSHCSYGLYDTKLKPAGRKVLVSCLNQIILFDTLLKYEIEDIQQGENYHWIIF